MLEFLPENFFLVRNMSTQHYVGVDVRKGQSVQDLRQFWDPSLKKEEPKLTFFQKVDQRIHEIPYWIKASFIASLIILEVALVFQFLDGCAYWYRVSHPSTDIFCLPVNSFLSWCASEPYCKPLAQAIGWLR